jgi:acyl-[acyl carrier protein]--UDP-N-acetylglucosamine O-acyltransferase
MPSADIQAVRKAFNLLYRGDLMLSLAVARVEAELGANAAVREVIAFIRASKRGIPGAHRANDSQAA